MSEYGRGPGPGPWPPEDPRYGEPGWDARQAGQQAGQQPPGGGHDPYAYDAYGPDAYGTPPPGPQAPGGQGPPGVHPAPQDGYGGYGGYGEGYGHTAAPGPGAYRQDPYGQDPYAQDAYGQEAYGRDSYTQDSYTQDSYTQGTYPHDPYGHQGPPPVQDQGPAQRPYGGDGPYDPYGAYGGGPYGTAQHFSYGAAAPAADPAGASRPAEPGYGHPPSPAGSRGPAADAPEPRPADTRPSILADDRPAAHPDDDQDGPDGRDPRDDDEDDGPQTGPRRGRDRRARQRGRRNGAACLVVAVVLTGVVAGGGLYGYRFWQDHFGAPPDYAGEGTGQAQVDIPAGAGGAEIGRILQQAGVVKSGAAFVDAVNDSGKAIQPGTYSLRKEMSAASAVTLMTDPASLNALIVTEGMRDSQIYAAIDRKTGRPAGTTKSVALQQAHDLGLPAWADDNPKVKDPLEGFLFPSRYSVGKGADPAAVLRQMVAQAAKTYAAYDLAGKARELGLKSPLQLVTVASLVQAEGKTSDDFRKMAEVVYNRLRTGNAETNGKLEFDSTYNYIKDQSKLDISTAEIRGYDNPYNTYYYRGLPPGPIGNPGEEALKAAMDPDSGGWYYFISLDGRTTQFTRTYAEHQKLVQQFNARRGNG
ncbi:endolytic transglycosylase MltG [Streptomyces sp. B1866]|uniref:endolytic transglycosylase MltG n=1 Tax=Streptomyces sp. B1866 TaxID=3075431 RepID=UPI002890A391|nr:endolytic transglycosylase MltG [Streptomyces sp. B1866]MDT3399204.1 endolytic transglycosylase MltG [Streptomyces sp. B1866]